MNENFINFIENKNENFIIFDIGSSNCIQSIEFYNNFPNSKIYAFECNPDTLEICKKNIEKYSDRITLVEGVVSDYDGNLRDSSIFKNITECHRLDSIMEKYCIPNVDIIWMDLQGAELFALKGLGDHLSNVKYIYTKTYHKPIYTNQALFTDINDYLVNYYCFNLMSEINPINQFEDVMYENKFHKNPIFNKINLTYEEQTFVRGKPKEYILHTINLLKRFTNEKVILEIGSIRQNMNHDIIDFNPNCCNDGHSTYFWKKFTNADIYTVDIDSKCRNLIDNDQRLVGVKSFTDDAIQFAKNFDKKIDLLFLDAWDVIDNTPYAEKHLEIFYILKDKLAKNCLILIDDTDIAFGGKGKFLIPVLVKRGFRCIFNRRQTLFMRIDNTDS